MEKQIGELKRYYQQLQSEIHVVRPAIPLIVENACDGILQIVEKCQCLQGRWSPKLQELEDAETAQRQ